MKSPSVTVFIPAYNAEAYLGDAIESVIGQTFTDFELLIIDDGSGDRTRQIADAWAARDARIRVISRENRGRPATRNEAFDLARGRYLASLDADDICVPERIERQAAFMDAHPDVVLCGSRNIHVRNPEDLRRRALSRSIMRKHPLDVRRIRAVQFFDCAIRQSTAMFRMDAVRARPYRYNPAYPMAEDFELWSQILRQDDVVANLPDVLVYYRRHDHQCTRVQYADVLAHMACAARATWRRYGIDTGSAAQTAKLLRPEFFASFGDLPGIVRTYRALREAVATAGDVDVAMLKKLMWMHLRRAFKRSLRRAPWTVPRTCDRVDAQPHSSPAV